MNTTSRTLIAAAIALLLGGSSLPVDARPEPPPEPVVTDPVVLPDPPGIYGADTVFAAVIEAALDRYPSAGLTLPPLRIYVHPSSDGCQGHKGTYGQYGERDRVDLCTEARFYVLHELAHAWEQHTLSDQTRQAWLDEMGLTVWHDRSIPWLESGAEVAANTIAWGLMDVPLTEAETYSFSNQLDRFELLTGLPSPRIG